MTRAVMGDPDRWVGVVVGLAVSLTLGVVSCGREPRQPPTNVLLLTLDTTRADRLGCYGYEQATTPNLDRLAREGARFKNATSPSPTTLPAHASILTGLFPPSHGARNNGNYRLVPEITTLAEILAREGYATAAFIAADVLSRKYGLEQGFELYEDDLLEGALKADVTYRQRSAESVVGKALPWIETHREKPFFAWIHFFDPHAPYEPHPGFRKAHPYDSEIAYMDAAVGQILAKLEEWDVLDRTVLVVIGDHGESLGEHGEETHGLFVYESTLRVPLILRARRLVRSDVTIDAAVSSVDVFPTVLDFLGISPPYRVQGRSLRGLLEGRKDNSSRVTYFETLAPRYEYFWSGLSGLREGMMKFIRAPSPELYDLASDPGEEKDLLRTARRAEATAWKRRLDQFVASLTPPKASGTIAMSEESEAALRALGYTFAGAETHTDRELPDPPDPKDEIHKQPLYMRIEEALRHENWQEVIRLTGAGASSEPPDLYQANMAARARIRLGHYGEARDLCWKILGLMPADPWCTRGLASIYLKTGQYARALQLYERAVRLDPLQALSHAGLADTHLALGDTAKAREHWEKAVELDPYFAKPANNLGSLAFQAGRLDSAARWFERVLEIDPAYERARKNLLMVADHYASQGAWAELLRVAEGQLRNSPEDPYWSFHHAQALAGLGRQEASEREYARLREMPDLPPSLRSRVKGTR